MIYMVNKKNFSVNDDFNTGFLFKLLLILGIALLVVFLFIEICSFVIGPESSGIVGQIYSFAQTTYPSTILAFSIIIIGVSLVMYFFHIQFVKLATIAEEVENEDSDL